MINKKHNIKRIELKIKHVNTINGNRLGLIVEYYIIMNDDRRSLIIAEYLCDTFTEQKTVDTCINTVIKEFNKNKNLYFLQKHLGDKEVIDAINEMLEMTKTAK